MFHFKKHFIIGNTMPKAIQPASSIYQAEHVFLFFFFPYWSCMFNLARWNEQEFLLVDLPFPDKIIKEFGNFLEVADSLQEPTIQIRLLH